MKLLYFSQFYAPESIAPAFRAIDNSKFWTEMGHDVTVFTGYPILRERFLMVILLG